MTISIIINGSSNWGLLNFSFLENCSWNIPMQKERVNFVLGFFWHITVLQWQGSLHWVVVEVYYVNLDSVLQSGSLDQHLKYQNNYWLSKECIYIYTHLIHWINKIIKKVRKKQFWWVFYFIDTQITYYLPADWWIFSISFNLAIHSVFGVVKGICCPDLTM